VINFLVGHSQEAQELRATHLIKIVPMLNPDGVVLGNYRSSLAGVDLNRQWKRPAKEITPCVYYMKELFRVHGENLVFYCDLHGHSRKFDSFFYGCKNKNHAREQVIPYLMGQHTKHFSYAKSKFGVMRSKNGTGRVVTWKEFRLTNCYTLEASFAGPTEAGGAKVHYGTNDLEEIGASLCASLHRYYNATRSKQVMTGIVDDLNEFQENLRREANQLKKRKKREEMLKRKIERETREALKAAGKEVYEP